MEIWLKMTSAAAIGGRIRPKDDFVQVPENLARNLLRRGKAVIPDRAELEAHLAKIGVLAVQEVEPPVAEIIDDDPLGIESVEPESEQEAEVEQEPEAEQEPPKRGRRRRRK